jgi:hypothetical protein
MAQITDAQLKRIAGLFGAAAALIQEMAAQDTPSTPLAQEWLTEYRALSQEMAKPQCTCGVGPMVPNHWHLDGCPLRKVKE